MTNMPQHTKRITEQRTENPSSLFEKSSPFWYTQKNTIFHIAFLFFPLLIPKKNTEALEREKLEREREMASSSFRVEAERWLNIAEKLLAARDLHGAKAFAIRARESDPRLFEFSDQIIAVVETLLAAEIRISNNCLDYYAILQLARLTQSMELVATQYRKLALLLNPNRNRLSYADRAFELVSEAWLVFSNPAKKAMYDRELELSQLVQLGQLGQHYQHHPESQGVQTPVRRPASAGIGRDGRIMMEEENVAQPFVHEPTRPVLAEPTRPAINIEWNKVVTQPAVPEPAARPMDKQANAESSSRPAVSQQTSMTESTRPVTQSTPTESQPVPGFWTACPYCYTMYEYAKVYEGCALKCQNCKRAFHAVVLPSPPLAGKNQYFCCWANYPMGYRGKRIYKDDLFIEISDSSDESDSDDDDWRKIKIKKRKSTKRGPHRRGRKKKLQNERGKENNQSAGGGGNVPDEVRGKVLGNSTKKKGTKDLGKLDLNVMFSNEVEEAVPGVSGRNGTRHGAEEDNIEGIGFFEGLDEFLSSLPILSVVGDDKAKAN